jgi:ribonuclease HII
MVRQETSRASIYSINKDDAAVEIAFITDGDSSDFLIALSSIIGKYVRECTMRLFNNFWDEKVGISRPCAGYGKDVHRFMREVKPHIARFGLSEDDILRSK